MNNQSDIKDAVAAMLDIKDKNDLWVVLGITDSNLKY